MINFNVKSIANNKISEKTLDKPFPTVDIQGRNSQQHFEDCFVFCFFTLGVLPSFYISALPDM